MWTPFRRPVLEALGLNTFDILAAAADRYNGSLHPFHLCTGHEGGHIARVYDGVYHSDHGQVVDNSEEDEQRINLVEDKEEDWEGALKVALKDASKNGISSQWKQDLELLIREWKDFIPLRLKWSWTCKGQATGNSSEP